MKAYLMKFKDQAFEGSMSLFKRTLVPGIVLNIISTILSLLFFIPLLLLALGWTISDLVKMEDRMKELGETMQAGGEPGDFFRNLFTSINFTYIILAFIVVFIIFSWVYNAFLTLNDNEVRNNDNSIMSAIRNSFNSRVFTILAYIIVQYLLMFVIIGIYIAATIMFYKIHPVLGGLFGFVFFFIMLMMMLRFVIALPAIVHGKMSLGTAISFSLRNITFKRAGMLLLTGLLFLIVVMIISGLGSFLFSSIFNKQMLGDVGFYSMNQIFSSIIGSITSVFLFAALSTLYFRYSDDVSEDMEFKEHLIS